MDYGSLIYVTLQRAHNAKEAIKIMTDLVKKYGMGIRLHWTIKILIVKD